MVIRYSDALYGNIDTVSAHRTIVEARGSVWLAKVGKPLGLSRIKTLKEQIDSGIGASLYLVQHKAGKYSWTGACLEDVRRGPAPSEEELIPKYYKESGLLNHAATWFRVSGFYDVTPKEKGSLVVASSRRPIGSALTTSMAAMFIVCHE